MKAGKKMTVNHSLLKHFKILNNQTENNLNGLNQYILKKNMQTDCSSFPFDGFVIQHRSSS